jgi:hypothetical protein
MLHCGSEQVTRQQVEAVPVPAHTQSWKPVSYADAIGYLYQQTERILGLEVESEQYGLNKNGDQMFALLTLKTDREDNGLSIGLRQSYNKSLSLGVAVGAQVFVCDNLCFSGDAFKVLRRNTVNVWSDFRALLTTQISNALGHYADVNAEVDHMRGIPCPERRGFAILGVAIGEGVLTPTQATVAYEDWKRPRHEDFAERNLYSLYNCATEGLKKGAPGRVLDRHARAHAFFTEIQGI